MVGFVGIQARKRRRNKILFIIIIIFALFMVFYLPSINFSNLEQDLPDEILPDSVIDKTSLASEIEELKLEVFQKDQRIKFRDKQIKNLREELKKLNKSFKIIKDNYDNALGDIDKIESNSSENLSENTKKLIYSIIKLMN